MIMPAAAAASLVKLLSSAFAVAPSSSGCTSAHTSRSSGSSTCRRPWRSRRWGSRSLCHGCDAQPTAHARPHAAATKRRLPPSHTAPGCQQPKRRQWLAPGPSYKQRPTFSIANSSVSGAAFRSPASTTPAGLPAPRARTNAASSATCGAGFVGGSSACARCCACCGRDARMALLPCAPTRDSRLQRSTITPNTATHLQQAHAGEGVARQAAVGREPEPSHLPLLAVCTHGGVWRKQGRPSAGCCMGAPLSLPETCQ